MPGVIQGLKQKTVIIIKISFVSNQLKITIVACSLPYIELLMIYCLVTKVSHNEQTKT